MNYDFTTSSSFVILNFVNGWRQGYYFRECTNGGFIRKIKDFSDLV